MITNNKKRTEGFTIVEVLIVLAIAGLILLIVLMAVPALRRQGNNTQRKTDVGNILSSMTEFANSNEGKLPQVYYNTGSAQQWRKDSSAGTGLDFKTGYYTNTDIDYAYATSAATLATVDSSKVFVRNYMKCKVGSLGPLTGGTSVSTTGLVENTGATARNVVGIYAVEGTSGNVTLQCLDI